MCLLGNNRARERERGYLPEPGGSRVGEDGLLGPWGAASEEEGPDLTVDSPLSCLDAHTEDEREDHDVFLSKTGNTKSTKRIFHSISSNEYFRISPTLESDRQIF